MPIVKRIGWLLVGAIIGAIAVSTLTAAQLPPLHSERRLISLHNAGTIDSGSAYFIKDTKTGACWLTVRWTSLVRHEDARDPGSEQKHYPPVPTLIIRRTLRPSCVAPGRA